MIDLNKFKFDALMIKLASPEEIKSWSYGEITKPETINYRTLKPEKGGLFDERIFGPTKDLECYCGKYKRQRYKGVICDKCGVEVTYARVRRERMGHIELASPVVHTWYFKRSPNKIPAILDVGLRDLESVIYFAQYLVTEVDEEKRTATIARLDLDLDNKKRELENEINSKIEEIKANLEAKTAEIKGKAKQTEGDELRLQDLEKNAKRETLLLREELIKNQDEVEESFKQVKDRLNGIDVLSIISEPEMAEYSFWEVDDFFTANMGAEVVLEALAKINIDEQIDVLNEIIKGKSKTRRQKAIKRIKILLGLKDAHINPESMILQILPVIPPDLRPIVQLPGGRFATSDLNDLYRRVINRNNRLKELIQLGAPQIILQNEKRMLQEAVDSLIEGSKKITRGRKELQSLSDMLKGKQGRFRQNLLGKRVDYSGRSVIVVGPTLRMDQVGVPKDMALELFKPFVLRDLIIEGYAPNLKSAKHVLDARGDEVWDILERVTKNHPILLNRAPTLHRQNIQAFYPILIEGKAITFHPAVVGSFAGDFDGDQMAIHVPLSEESIAEARTKLLAPHNILKLAHGKPIFDLKHDLSLGLYYLTMMDENAIEAHITFYSDSQALSALDNGKVEIHTPILIWMNKKWVTTSPGRVLFNSLLPEKLRYVNRNVNRDVMRNLIAQCFDEYGEGETVAMIDRFKDYGKEYATHAGASYSIFDFSIPKERDQIIKEAHTEIDKLEQNYQLGLMTPNERHSKIVGVWEEATSSVMKSVMNAIDHKSTIGMFLDSKAFKVNPETIRQVQGIRGLMVDSKGLIKETPITSSFLEGQSSFEGFLNMVGGRKSLIDVALLTAAAGYLTRRLVDAAHEVIIREVDCGTKSGITIVDEKDVEDWNLADRIEGRVVSKDIKDENGKVIVKNGTMITPDQATEIVNANITEVPVRSALTCETRFGVCSKCYGKDLGTRQLVTTGEAVGVIAAQSIGEPGTQLTLHSKHRAGVAKKEITHGLPRVEQLFEARSPKQTAVMSEIKGKVTQIEESDNDITVFVQGEGSAQTAETRKYVVPATTRVLVQMNQNLEIGDPITEGYLDLTELLDYKGMVPVQTYLLKEIQTVYKSQGVNINDKHIEVIVRKMTDKVRVKDPGDSNLLPGDYISVHEMAAMNVIFEAEGKAPIRGTRALLGISRSALLTNSWLSAASFEETTNVLTAASINERPNTDYLFGLKENVIIGRLIPTGDRSDLPSGMVEE